MKWHLMSYLIDEIITNIVRQENPESNIEIIDGRLENDFVKPGNNDSSEASRYVVNYKKNGKKQTKSVFLKVPYDVRPHDLLQKKGFYKKELYMYRTVLSSYQSLLPDDQVAALYYSSGENDAIVLEDLTETGYRMCDTHEQLDFEHCAVALKTLAKYHALSVKLHRTKPEILDEVAEESIFNSSFGSKENCTSFYESRFSKVANRADPEYAKAHSDTLEFFASNLVRWTIRCVAPSGNVFNVLNHGDFLTNNIMFKYDSYGRVSTAKLVDFQLCRWSSPAVDILYFTVNCMKFEIFEKYFDLLLELYVETLNAVMSYLECDQILTIDDLRQDVESKYNYAMTVLVGPAPLANAYGDLISASNDDKLLDEDRYVELSTKWFSYFIQKGVFSKYHDTVNAINTFLKNFQDETDASMTKYELDENIMKGADNFCSGISRLRLEYYEDGQKRRKSVLLKIPSLSPNYERVAKSIAYDREVYVYEILLPKMYELWYGPVFSPEMYAVTEAKVLVLEDLNEAGYTMKDKNKKLDLDHCKIALRTLAQYHALSVKFLQIRSKCYRDFPAEGSNSESSMVQFGLACFDRLVEAMSQTSVTKSFLEKLRRHREPIRNNKGLYCNLQGDGFNVVLHGDFWLNNILFKYDDDTGNVCGAQFVDWQFCQPGSPVIDLIVFFVSSVQFNTYEKYHDTLFGFYLDILNDTLSSLKCDFRYTRRQLDADIKKHKLFYVTALFRLQILMSDERCIRVSITNPLPTSYTSIITDWLLHLDAVDLL